MAHIIVNYCHITSHGFHPKSKKKCSEALSPNHLASPFFRPSRFQTSQKPSQPLAAESMLSVSAALHLACFSCTPLAAYGAGSRRCCSAGSAGSGRGVGSADCGEWGCVVLQSQECFDESWGIANTSLLLEGLFVVPTHLSHKFMVCWFWILGADNNVLIEGSLPSNHQPIIGWNLQSKSILLLVCWPNPSSLAISSA